MKNKRTYDVDINKLVAKTFKFLRNNDIPEHWSKTKNERYSVHIMVVFYVLFCLADRSYRRFEKLISSCPPTSFKLKKYPDFTTMWRAWRRFSPSFLRKLVQISGKGGRDKVAALDPTHFQITSPSLAYCKRTKRNPLREPNRKTTIVTGTRSLRILDAIIYKDSHRNGLDDLPKLLGNWVKGKTVAADTEFDAEERFHQAVIAKGGKGVAP